MAYLSTVLTLPSPKAIVNQSAPDAAMTTLNINLPEPMREFIDELVKAGQYHSADEYIQHLIVEDQQPFEPEWVEQAVLEGLKSGPGIAPDDAWWERKRAELIQRHGGARKG